MVSIGFWLVARVIFLVAMLFKIIMIIIAIICVYGVPSFIHKSVDRKVVYTFELLF